MQKYYCKKSGYRKDWIIFRRTKSNVTPNIVIAFVMNESEARRITKLLNQQGKRRI